MIFLEYFILTSPLTWELLTDWYRIEKRKREDNHKADIPVRIAMCLAVGFLCKAWFGAETIFQGFFYSGTMFIVFDPFLSLLRGKNVFHKGNNPLDKLWSQTPPHAEVFVRLWILAVGAVIYYRLEDTILAFIKW